jgi:hypothetical protein
MRHVTHICVTFAGENGGEKRRDSEKLCCSKNLRETHECTEVTHLCALVGLGKFVPVAWKNRRKFGD